MNRMKPAFTLIEILISVMILSVSIVAIFKIYGQNQERIVYITERNKHALEDSLFLGDEVLRYHREKRTAYDLLQDKVRPQKDESREILDTLTREIYIPEPMILTSLQEDKGIKVEVTEVKIKGTFSSSYFRFKILSF